MQDCNFCRWSAGKHDENCPTIQQDSDAARKVYWTAWEIGRQGQTADPVESRNPIYMMGFANGEVALEEAQNGC